MKAGIHFFWFNLTMNTKGYREWPAMVFSVHCAPNNKRSNVTWQKNENAQFENILNIWSFSSLNYSELNWMMGDVGNRSSSTCRTIGLPTAMNCKLAIRKNHRNHRAINKLSSSCWPIFVGQFANCTHTELNV